MPLRAMIAGILTGVRATTPASTLTNDLLSRFEQDRGLPGVIVMDGPHAAGVIGAAWLRRLLRTDHRADILRRQPVADLLIRLPRPVIAEAETPIEDVIDAALQRPDDVRHDPVIIRRPPGTDELVSFDQLVALLCRGLSAARAEVAESTGAKINFFTNISHELRTPLTAVLGHASMLRDGEYDHEQAAEAIESIYLHSQALLGLIDDVLEFTAIDAGDIDLHIEDVDLAEHVASIVERYRPRAATRHLTLECHIDEDVPRQVRIDAGRLKRILNHLLENAFKFTNAGGITCTLHRQHHDTAHDLEVRIEDTGIGIEPADAGRIFHPFEQVDPTRTRRTSGSGLGLALCQKLAEHLGGRIALHSEPGHGSTFTVRFRVGPCTSGPCAAAPPKTDHRTATIHHTSTGRLLIVDDGVDNQRLLANILRKADFDVDIASNGLESLAMIDHEGDRPYDLILMDMQMPEMDGYAATTLLRERGDDRPVLAITAHAMPHDRQRCFDAGCNDYLRKPIDRMMLIDMVRAWIVESYAPKPPYSIGVAP